MDLTNDPKDWQRLARAARLAREDKQLTQNGLGERAGVSGRSVQDLESGRVPSKRMPYTIAPIARALGWPPGTVDRILAGEAAPGWDIAEERPVLDARVVESAMTSALLRAVHNATAAEIRNAIALTLEELARIGAVTDNREGELTT